MENATEALKMGFAVLVLVVALSLTIYSFTRVRETSAQITAEADVKQYYQQLTLNETEGSTNAQANRIVGVETVIPTLYRYYKENYTILFYKGTGYNEANGTFEQITPMPLYYTETSAEYLNGSTLTTNEPDGRAIFGFDIQDEQVRREPWSANQDSSYSFIRAFVNGLFTDNYYTSRTSTNNPSKGNNFDEDSNGPYYQIQFYFNGDNRKSDGLLGKDYQFIERYGEYNFENVSNIASDDDGNLVQDYNILSNVTESVDILENNEIVVNNKGTTKRVIQYILIS